MIIRKNENGKYNEGLNVSYVYIQVLKNERKEACLLLHHNKDNNPWNVGTVYIFTRTHFGTKVFHEIHIAYCSERLLTNNKESKNFSKRNQKISLTTGSAIHAYEHIKNGSEENDTKFFSKCRKIQLKQKMAVRKNTDTQDLTIKKYYIHVFVNFL